MEKYSFKVPEVSSGECHVLPFEIGFSGQTENKLGARRLGDNDWHITFRGRPLQGKQIDLKDHVAVEIERQEESNRYRGVQTLEKYILYEHGGEPSATDSHGGRISELLEMAESISS